ncbi:MAG: DUF4105 domain-containing protein [Nitrospirota bacterium]|nr:DUF4105 domain-containing protein [Nitrospirota bacterium]
MREANARVYRALCSVYLFFALCLTLSPATAAAEADYPSTLVEAGRALRLADERYWNILLHYKKSGSGRESLVDDPVFFLSPAGKTDPEAELEATISGLFQGPELGDDHPRCRFPARSAWLVEQLSIDASRLTPVVCAAYDESMRNITMRSAVLVFPAAHGNGPASMFGHTLIRIDSTVQSDLMSYAVNYAAKMEDDSGPVYIFKGLFGFYKGHYSILPYYEKVKEYSGIEHRDIWEYRLNLTEDEIRRMVMHIWELRQTYSDYYFFTENCSYNLLFLLEAARPSLDLTDPYRNRARFWVIPGDTIRTLTENNAVASVKYRPSLATGIAVRARALVADEQVLAVALAEGRMKPAEMGGRTSSPERTAPVLDLAAEVLQYRYSKKELDREVYLQRYLSVLRARSTIAETSKDLSAIAEPPTQPELGHRAARLAMGAGWRSTNERRWFADLSVRPAYHDLMDPDDGYVEGAQINFFDLGARYEPDKGSLTLQKMHIVDILSLAPRDRFFAPVSWKFSTGLDRVLMKDGSERLVFRVNPGGGAAYRFPGRGLIYALFESDVQLSNVYEDRMSLGVGPSVGLDVVPSGRWKSSIQAAALAYFLGETHRIVSGIFMQSWMIDANNVISLKAKREKTFRHYGTEAVLSWNWYF